MWHMLTNEAISSAFKHADPRSSVRGRPTLKDGVVTERILRNGSFCELKKARESNDLAKVLLEPTEPEMK